MKIFNLIDITYKYFMIADTAKLITNCSDKINWDQIVETIKDKPGKELSSVRAQWNDRNSEYDKLFELYEKSNVSLASARWINYYPGKDYDDSTIGIFEDLLKVNHIRSWISRIDPGYCTPWHWDTDDNEHEYLNLGNLRRFTCHIGKPDFGHVFLIGKESHYFQEQGNLHEWSSHRAWHAGFNCGLTPKFLFNLLAYD